MWNFGRQCRVEFDIQNIDCNSIGKKFKTSDLQNDCNFFWGFCYFDELLKNNNILDSIAVGTPTGSKENNGLCRFCGEAQSVGQCDWNSGHEVVNPFGPLDGNGCRWYLMNETKKQTTSTLSIYYSRVVQFPAPVEGSCAPNYPIISPTGYNSFDFASHLKFLIN